MMRRPYTYDVVDVFTSEPLQGNALAVFPDARGLDGDTMQSVAREFNLAETAFVLPPERADHAARVRIFTPTMEMRFAGHPTIGTSFVMRERGLVARDADRFVLGEGIGDVPIRVERGTPDILWLTTPPISFGATFPREVCAEALGLAPDDLLDRVFMEAGFEWRQAGCSMCVGMNGDTVAPGLRSASTSNRNS